MKGGGDHSTERLYNELGKRFQVLEASQNELREQFNALVQEKTLSNNFREDETSHSASATEFSCVPRGNFMENPFKRVLEYMGHAVYVCRVGSGEILYWNQSAERLFGYKDYEVVGRVVHLFDEEHHPSDEDILEKWRAGEPWSGQLILKKRSGQIFNAMVTKSPLFEEGELIGIINVSSDANIFNSTNSEYPKIQHCSAHEQPKVTGMNWKKIQWHPYHQVSAVPQIASSVSNLASKVLLRKRDGNSASNVFSNCRTKGYSEEGEIKNQGQKTDQLLRAPTVKPILNIFTGNSRTDGERSEQDDSKFELAQPSKIAARFLSKLHIGGMNKKSTEESILQNGAASALMEKKEIHCTWRDSRKDIGEYQAHTEMRSRNQLSKSSLQVDDKESVSSILNIKSMDAVEASPQKSTSQNFPCSDGSDDTDGGASSSKDGNESQMVLDCEILWEDLHLREEIGQGSFAVVYRGIWMASDVAVKIYCGNHYNEETLLDYKKEIDIMRRLRHPNVLLFMGAACSQEKLAVVTEYLPRGSLFKTLHKNNQSLDIRRRLRMAIDVARGMNYLHRRNPPIVHRDLKSSNLLVDKSWTVKVGDFGLSKLKNTTFLTTKSGRGTPQWMAPEVLRSEPTTEKSDVYSFGVILWELMTECIPWNNLNPLQVVGVVGFMDRRLELPKNINPQVSSIISDCWQSNPENRPSFQEIIHKMTELVQTSAGATPRTSSLS